MANTTGIERLEQEGARAYAAFVEYAEMGPKRSLSKLRSRLRKSVTKGSPKQSLDQLKRWSTRWRWVARASARDEAMAKIGQAEEVRVVRRAARDRALERAELADRLREMAKRLYAKAHEMLEQPIKEVVKHETYEDGREKLTIMKPARWSFGDAARLVETVAQLSDTAMALEEAEPGLSREQSQVVGFRLAAVVLERVQDPAVRLAVLAAVQPLLGDVVMDGDRE